MPKRSSRVRHLVRRFRDWFRDSPLRRESARRGVALECLEDRRLLAGGLLFQANESLAVTLRLAEGTVQIVETSEPATILASKPLAEITAGVRIEGNAFDVSLTMDGSLSAIAGGIQFVGGTGTNSLTGPNVATDWLITGPGSGSFGVTTFTGVESLVGGAGADAFAIAGSFGGIVDGGGGKDVVTVSGNLSLSDVDLEINAETINVPSGASISAGAGDVTLNAMADADGLSDTIATVAVGGEIITSGVLRITAKTQGTVALQNLGGDITNRFTDSATIAITDSTRIEAHTIELTAQRLTTYSAAGRAALNQIAGDVKAEIDGSTVVTGAGGLTVSALDSIALLAESPTYQIDVSGLVSLSAAVARNELSGDAEACIRSSTVTAAGGDVHVTAEWNAALRAAAAASSMNNPDDPAAVALEVAGTYTSNTVQGKVQAYLAGSDVHTLGTGNVLLDARNTSTITATTNISAIATGDVTAEMGGAVAINSIGWAPQNELFNIIDAFIGSPEFAEAFGSEESAAAQAWVADSTVDTAGSLTVDATSSASITAAVVNTSESDAAAWAGAVGVTFDAVIAMNKVSSGAVARLTNTTVHADGGTIVGATDRAYLDSNIVLESDVGGSKRADLIALGGAVTLNDVRGGATAFVDTSAIDGGAVQVTASEQAVLNAYLASAATSGPSKRLSLAASGLVATNTVQGGAEAYLTGSTIGTATDRVGGNVTVRATNSCRVNAFLVNATVSGEYSIAATLALNTVGWESQNILFNTVDALLGSPEVADAFGNEDGAGAKAYLRDTTVEATGGLTVEAKAGASITAEITNDAEASARRFTGATGLSFGAVIGMNKVASKASATIAWSAGYSGAKTLTADRGVTVKATDSAMIGATITLIASAEAVSTSPFNDSDSYGIAGAVSLNDVRGGATAAIDGATLLVSSGQVLVQALADATINSSLDSETSSANDSLFGNGDSLAVGALIATNTVQGGAAADVTDSHLTTTGPGGDITVDAVNTSTLKAATVNSATSEGISVSATLAFNTIGWESQNILFNAVDAILGDPLISEAFGGETGAGAKAYLLDTTVDATGLLRVNATSSAGLTADIRNQAVSDAEALTGTSGMSFGAVIALNKTSSKAEATIDWSDSYSGAKTIIADGGVTVNATDSASAIQT